MEGKREAPEGCNVVGKKENEQIDADLYSRQLGTYGFELMNKLIKLNVLIVNVKSVGLECAKNLILSGPKSVCIYDNDVCQVSDIGVNFYVDEEDVEKKVTRSDAVIKQLQELNSYVHIYNYKGELNEEFLQSFDVVVCCDVSHSHLVKYSKMVRSISPAKKIAFLCCNIYGLCGYLFVDFGKGFVCYDKDGENTKSCNISKISKAPEGVVSFDCDKGTPFQKGDYVKFNNVEGMSQINNKIYKIKDMLKYTFTIGDTSQFDDYLKGGECTQVKSHLRMDFQPYDFICGVPLSWEGAPSGAAPSGAAPSGAAPSGAAPSGVTPSGAAPSVGAPSGVTPTGGAPTGGVPTGSPFTTSDGETIYEDVPPPQSFLISDYAKCDMSNQLHYAIQALKRYEAENNNMLPHNFEEEAFEKVFQIAVRLNEEDKQVKRTYAVEEVKKDVVLNVAKYCTAHLAPVASFFGGLLAQEVIKFTGKYMPIYQLLYLDFFECISLGKEGDTGVKNDDIAKENSKNDNIITVFGKAFQKRLNELNVFLVGSGALGCEYAKLFSLLDMCSVRESGKLTITDNDNIEVSNLNRQFLFRRENVGKSKSLVASEIIKKKNPNMNVESLETKVGTENEHLFNEKFWTKQNMIVNALDNIQARQYVDNKCVWYSKPLFESGTLGTKGNVQIILPFLTQSYNDSYDPPEDSIPLCTLKHFPYDIIHTIEYARDIFQGLFYNTPLSLQEFLKDKKEYVKKVEEEGNNASLLETMHNVLTTLREVSKESNFKFCIKKAVDLFYTNFINQINQLLYSFPLDYKLASGEFFWVGQKKPPQVIPFDINNEFVKEFLFSTSNLFAQVYNIPQCYDMKYILDVASQIEVKPFQPKKVKVKMDEKNLNNISISFVDDEKMIQDFCKELLNIECDHVKVSPIEFDKDEETNMHVNFIYSFANLRAINYKIETCDKLKAKIVAGKIIPALATTTSIITGLVGIELLKYVNYCNYLETYVKSTEEKKKEMKDLLSYFKNAFINSALPLFLFSEPMPPIRMRDKEYDELMKGPVRAIPNGFTSWDKIQIQIANGTIKNLIDHINEQFSIEVNLISVGNACLYNCYLPAHNKERLNRPIHELYSEITKQKLLDDKNYIVVEASCSDQDLVDVLIPSIKFIYK
ncbi:ubiquitin-activating enzyme e1 [Plasmodium cynomolgi strain B]|uniref:E1 ubiquitin-activating enzyme n=1 Tax=Plasmodium cynomolgi (strain B) TaxID=1120755 RepID=K6VIA2_PLACD|nr:ubiquitin-activating enzyme e1 [Plasmodium cynomolgi strain B]GAB69087.1 ubiquitin-activating enzyme e1 [Plasmodium cynomolgi strain B]